MIASILQLKIVHAKKVSKAKYCYSYNGVVDDGVRKTIKCGETNEGHDLRKGQSLVIAFFVCVMGVTCGLINILFPVFISLSLMPRINLRLID